MHILILNGSPKGKNSIKRNRMMKTIEVTAAIIIKDGKVFATQRGYGDWKGWWEFPGGKIEPGESAAAAAARELHEELNLEIYPADTMYITVYQYPDKGVELNFVRCFCFDFSMMKMLDGQDFRWADVLKTDAADLLPADKDFLKFLQMEAIKF